MIYKINHIPKSSKRPGTRMNPTTITIHSTANPNSTALNERNWLVNKTNTRVASWHIAVDDKMAVEAIPLNEIAYHAGSRVGNETSISIEICESGNRKKTIENTVELTAKLLHDKSWGVDRLRRHYDWSKKNCPRILNYNNWEGWEYFKRQVQAHLNSLIYVQEHWAEKHFKSLNSKGILIHERRFNEPITRAEVFALIDRATKALG